MYILNVNVWFQNLMRQFFAGIDRVIYGFISLIYDLLLSIARTSAVSQSDLIDMAEKIYKLLIVFMVFKVTFSLITYVVNPDDFSDKNKGISKLAMNIILSLCYLILTPYIFNYAYRLQAIVLEDNILANFLFDTGDNENSNFLNTGGDQMAFITMGAFFTPNTSIEQLSSCVKLRDKITKNVNINCSGISDDYEVADGLSNPNNTMYALTKEATESLGANKNENFKKNDLINYIAAINNENFGLMFRDEMIVARTNDDDYIMNYRYLFSTIVGIIIVLLLLSFCMDVAIRSVKLSFFQLIAPIPILSYADPKGGKDGMFKKWYQACIKTYISLFIRLLALYFAIYIISRLDSMVDIVDGSYQTNIFVQIFIIIGALMFAKDLPKILESLGIKLDGDGKFVLNPLKKFEERAIGGKNITGMARGALVGAAGMASGAGFGRAFSGAWRGLTSGKGWKETGKAEAEMNRKMRQAKLDGSTFGGRLGARFAGATGFISESEILASERNDLDQVKKDNETKIKVHDDKIKEYEAQKRALAYEKKQKKAVTTDKIRRAEMIANNAGTAKSMAVENLATSTGAAGAKYRSLETRAKVYEGNIGRYLDSNGNLTSLSDSAYSRLSSAKKSEYTKITEKMATDARSDFSSYQKNGWVDYVNEVYQNPDLDLGLSGNIEAAIGYIASSEGQTEADVRKELENDPDGFGKALKNKIGDAKGDITKAKQEAFAIDDEYYAKETALDASIEAETIAKRPLEEESIKIAEADKELSKREKVAKANESAIK